MKLPGGGVVRSANLTPDADTGIGTWTEQQFVDKFKAFEGAEHRTLSAAEQRENTWMPWYAYAGMTREDLGAIYAYLRSPQAGDQPRSETQLITDQAPGLGLQAPAAFDCLIPEVSSRLTPRASWFQSPLSHRVPAIANRYPQTGGR